MKTIIKELNLLEISDIEKAVSDYLERPVKISEINCEITYWLDKEHQPSGMFLDFGFCDAEELFYDKELGGYYLNGARLSINEPWLPLNEIFAFDVSEFGKFSKWVDIERY